MMNPIGRTNPRKNPPKNGKAHGLLMTSIKKKYNRRQLRDKMGDEGLLGLIKFVHMANTGSLETTTSQYEDAVNILKEWKKIWEKSLPTFKKFDDAVYQLIDIVLKEPSNMRI